MADYRVIEYEDGSGCGLHEVWIAADESGVSHYRSEKPVSFMADTKGELIADLRRALRCAVENEVCRG